MKVKRILIPATAFAVAFGATVVTAWPQTTTETDSTATTVPAAPTVTRKTVTRKTVENPPPVVINPSTESTETTTTTDSTAPQPPPTVERKSTKTTIGPLGISHSESREENSDD